MDYLAKRAEELNVKTEINPNLEEWFYNDPVERTVNLEAGIIAKKRELEQAKRGPDEARPVSPGTRFEEMEEQEDEVEHHLTTLHRLQGNSTNGRTGHCFSC